MTIFEQLLSVFEGSEGILYSTAEIKAALTKRYGTNPDSVIPSDYCYNRWNHGLGSQKPVFVRVGFGEYRFIGPDRSYTGLIFGRPRGASTHQVVGEWVDGERRLYSSESKRDKAGEELDSTPIQRDILLPLSQEQLSRLYQEYMEILMLEVAEFGCKPTETRHLIGRLGEFFCARKTGGWLARRVNQPGFDVLASDGRRVSVKTTAQSSGFVSINGRTLELVDDLMVLRYDEGDFEIVYYGGIQAAVNAARSWEGRFELDLARARRLQQELGELK